MVATTALCLLVAAASSGYAAGAEGGAHPQGPGLHHEGRGFPREQRERDEAGRHAGRDDDHHHGGRRAYEATSRHAFDDVEHWRRVFDDPNRDRWQKPAEVIAALGLAPGMTVADIGAGTGYFSAYLSRAVGSSGTVFAVETEPNLVAHLRKRAEQERTRNVIPVLGSFDNPRLPPQSIDLALIVDTFHHIDGRLEYFRDLASRLTPRGRVVVIDWQPGRLPVGPPPDHKLAAAQVVREMGAAGYRLVAEPRMLTYQYFLVFRLRGR